MFDLFRRRAPSFRPAGSWRVGGGGGGQWVRRCVVRWRGAARVLIASLRHTTRHHKCHHTTRIIQYSTKVFGAWYAAPQAYAT